MIATRPPRGWPKDNRHRKIVALNKAAKDAKRKRKARGR